MGSELTYRGHEPQTTFDQYFPKPNKPWLSVIRPIRYILREQRLLFILIGILIGAVFISLISSGSGAETISYRGDYSVSGTEILNPRMPVYRPGFGSMNSGGKIPLGLKRRGLRIVVTGGAGFVESHLVNRLIARVDSVI